MKPRARRPNVRRLWAIDCRRADWPGGGPHYLGVGYFGPIPTAAHAALTTALWTTRREARGALDKVLHKGEPGAYVAFPRARVARVVVTVKPPTVGRPR